MPAGGPWHDEGAIVLHVLVDGAVAGALKLADEVRPESRQAVDALHKLGIQVVMITGDAESVARAVADDLGIDRVFAGVRPEDKAAKVAELATGGTQDRLRRGRRQRRPRDSGGGRGGRGGHRDRCGHRRGDRIGRCDPGQLRPHGRCLSVILLSKATYRKMKQNLWWAAGYNLISVPLAAGVLAPIGFVMPMSVGAILMSASTVVVALNAQLLRRLDLRPEASVRAVL